MRASTTQPSFNLFTGGANEQSSNSLARPPSRGTSGLRARTPSSDNLRSSTAAPPPDAHELNELKAEIKTLKYTLSTRAQEEELMKLRQEADIREVRRKGDEDFKKMQLAEGERNKAVRQYEELMKEVQELRDQGTNEKAAMERKLREEVEARRRAEEDMEDVRSEADERVRMLERRLVEEESRNASLQNTMREMQEDFEGRDGEVQQLNERLVQKEAEIGGLESEVLRLKAQTGDVDTLEVIKRELGEQVSHIRTLEATNREQLRELKHLRQLHKGIEIVEEEKRQLQRKVDMMNDLEQELGEARLQQQRLEDERLAWTAYLQSQAQNGQLEFDSPEAIARALMQERLEAATLLEKLGRLEPAVSERDSIIQRLESDKSKLTTEIEKLKTSGGGGDLKARARLERQRTLALKEVEYLRAQIKTFDSEESTMELPSYDEAKALRITQLEDMVASYSAEVSALHAELSAITSSTPIENGNSLKRTREDSESHEQLGQLTRKNRKLQDELSSLKTEAERLKKELSVTQERLFAATSHRQTRILQLRDNPTSTVEKIKMSTLQSLREENAALLAQLTTGTTQGKVVPVSSLEAAQRDCKEMEKLVADTRKSMARLKQVWGQKTAEFREAISSLLGWKVEFMPNGKMKVTSLFYPSTEDSENSIVFDGENGMFCVLPSF
jgi:mitotic spindle assembly checkpoint protein MAD1